MARPLKFDRGEAVETAMQEIWRSGYEASSVKAISEKLGVTRSCQNHIAASSRALHSGGRVGRDREGNSRLVSAHFWWTGVN